MRLVWDNLYAQSDCVEGYLLAACSNIRSHEQVQHASTV